MSGFVRTTAINKLLRLTKKKKVVQGGTSAGKTFGILPVLIDRATKNPLEEISVVSESIPHLRRGALKDFLKIMKLTGRFIEKNYNKTLLTYTFENGSYIEFFSVDDESRVRGARRTRLYVNEANNISFETYHQLAVRTSKEIFIDFNPTAEFWAHNEVLKESNSELLKLNYLDNEALDKSIIEEIESAREKAKTSAYWENWWKVYGLGEVGKLQGVVFDNWETIKEIPVEARYVGTGLDFGFTNDPTAAVAVYYYNGYYVWDELLYEKKLLNDKISEELYGLTNIIADSADPKSIAELELLGLDIYPAEKGPDSVNYGIQLIQQNKFFVTEKSVNLIRELRSYCWLTDKSGASLNKPVGKNDHAIDAARYFYLSLNSGPRDVVFSVY